MTDAATVKPAPAFSPVALHAPARRGRGRPRKDGTTGDTAPRSPGRPRSTSSIRTEVGALLVTVNLPLTMFLPVDALAPEEIDALAMSIDDQCKRSPRFRSYVMRALKVQSATSLLAVVAMIGGRRAARHGIIPESMQPATIDASLGLALRMMTGTAGGDTSAYTPPPAFTPLVEPEPELVPIATVLAFTPPES